MDNQDHSPANETLKLVQEDALVAARRLGAASALGFAILDNQLRYQAINHPLVAMNGFSADAHLGNTVRDLFGDHVAGQIAPRVKRLVATGKPSVFEICAILPARSEPGSWVDHYFAIHGAAGKVIGIGLVVVEATEQRMLDGFVNRLTRDLLRKQTRDNYWLARELHDSIDQYHLALGMSISHLTETPERGPEVLAKAVESLDERILAMRRLLAMVATGFLDHSEF
jgi:hypothetical protein